MRIVGLIRMHQHAVHERGVNSPAENVGADYGSDAVTLVGACELNGKFSGRQFRA